MQTIKQVLNEKIIELVVALAGSAMMAVLTLAFLS
jgi:hypothetical protein